MIPNHDQGAILTQDEIKSNQTAALVPNHHGKSTSLLDRDVHNTAIVSDVATEQGEYCGGDSSYLGSIAVMKCSF